MQRKSKQMTILWKSVVELLMIIVTPLVIPPLQNADCAELMMNQSKGMQLMICIITKRGICILMEGDRAWLPRFKVWNKFYRAQVWSGEAKFGHLGEVEQEPVRLRHLWVLCFCIDRTVHEPRESWRQIARMAEWGDTTLFEAENDVCTRYG